MLQWRERTRLYLAFESASLLRFLFFFQAEDGIRDWSVTGVQTCALPICTPRSCPDSGGRPPASRPRRRPPRGGGAPPAASRRRRADRPRRPASPSRRRASSRDRKSVV